MYTMDDGSRSYGEGRNKKGRHLNNDFSTISARNRIEQPVNPQLETVACQTGSVTLISAEDEHINVRVSAAATGIRLERNLSRLIDIPEACD